MPIQKNGVAATVAELHAIRRDIGVSRSIPGLGDPVGDYIYGGALIDAGNLPADGGPADYTSAFGSVPADAIGVEVMLTNTGATDYLFWAGVGGRLNTAGADLAAKTAANLQACRWVAGGQRMVIPFVTQGVLPSTWRFAAGGAANARLAARWILATSRRLPYLAATTTEVVLTGAGAQQTLPSTDTNRFPPGGYSAMQFQVLGGPIRLRHDGSPITAATGIILQPGSNHVLDFARDGITIESVRLWMASGSNLVGVALKDR